MAAPCQSLAVGRVDAAGELVKQRLHSLCDALVAGGVGRIADIGDVIHVEELAPIVEQYEDAAGVSFFQIVFEDILFVFAEPGQDREGRVENVEQVIRHIENQRVRPFERFQDREKEHQRRAEKSWVLADENHLVLQKNRKEEQGKGVFLQVGQCDRRAPLDIDIFGLVLGGHVEDEIVTEVQELEPAAQRWQRNPI